MKILFQIFFSAFFLLASIPLGHAQTCTRITSPADGAVNVPLDTSLTWPAVNGVTGYIISIGTTPGGGEIVSNQAVGLSTTYTPPLGLPNNTTIYVRISLFFFNSQDIQCAITSFTTENVTTPPPCTSIVNPTDGETNVPLNTNLNWEVSIGSLGYFLSIGTSPGGSEILSNFDAGNTLGYNPPTNLTPNTTYYVRIVPYNANGSASGCSEVSFTTGDLGTAPECTTLITPSNGAINVALSPEIRWNPVANATGYLVTIGTTPFGNDILDNADFGNTTSTLILNFLPNVTAFVTIIPYNEAGEATGCTWERFSTTPGCGPFLDPQTGEEVSLFPDIDIPEMLAICEDDFPLQLDASGTAEGYRWYRILPDNTESFISENSGIEINDAGNYRIVAFNTGTVFGNADPVICETVQDITIQFSEKAVVQNLQITDLGGSLRIEVTVSGAGDYEYAIGSEEGPYQDSGIFLLEDTDGITLYIRDKNGCGITVQPLTALLFPPFFTPNGDSVNDVWNIRKRSVNDVAVRTLHIFDRYGTLLATLDPGQGGWDGTFNGNPMPSSDYWYAAFLESGEVLKGNFTLKR